MSNLKNGIDDMMKLLAPIIKKSSVNQIAQGSDSETENISVARTSTPVKQRLLLSKQLGECS